MGYMAESKKNDNLIYIAIGALSVLILLVLGLLISYYTKPEKHAPTTIAQVVITPIKKFPPTWTPLPSKTTIPTATLIPTPRPTATVEFGPDQYIHTISDTLSECQDDERSARELIYSWWEYNHFKENAPIEEIDLAMEEIVTSCSLVLETPNTPAGYEEFDQYLRRGIEEALNGDTGIPNIY